LEAAVRLSVILATVLAVLAGLVAVSHAIEWLRPVPRQPDRLAWAPDIAIRYVDIDGTKVRYIKTGAGPNLVLLHTLRTQLDTYQTMIPKLAQSFTVYALDYPGHGWSDIPRADYAPEDFYRWTASSLDKLDIRQATVVGVSIGATIALVLAARKHPAVSRVVAVNPYDYGPRSGGVRSSSLPARLVLTFAEVPVLSPTVMRLRNRPLMDRIFQGGLASPDALPPMLAQELYEVGNRPGHYQGFLNLLAHEHLWPNARTEYPRIGVPVLLVYGDQDWAPPSDRERTRLLIPGVTMETVRNGGHFLSLDRGDELTRLIVGVVTR
jgi:pimeloyl-ACP methyl ester carboxylesterase